MEQVRIPEDGGEGELQRERREPEPGGTRAAKREMSWVARDVWRVLSGEAPEWPAMPDADQ